MYITSTGTYPAATKQSFATSRLRRGLRQRALAKRAGLPTATISLFDIGVRKPSFDDLRRVADALEVSADNLVGRVNEPVGHGLLNRLHRLAGQVSSSDGGFAEEFPRLLARKSQCP